METSPRPSEYFSAQSIRMDFPAIEAMQEASKAVGWECEYRQLDAGRLEARTVLHEIDDFSFLRESANRRLNIVAESPAETVTIIVPASDSIFSINGINVVHNTVVIVPEKTGFSLFSEAGADALSMHVPAHRFRDGMRAASSGPATSLLNGVQGFEPNAATLHQLRRMIIDGTSEVPAPADQFGDKSTLEMIFVDLARSMLADGGNAEILRKGRTRDVLARSLDHIDANLCAELRITDLCQVAGVSLSTLERVFRSELRMTPLSYIRARRLDAVRRALIKGAPDTPIAQLAHDHGISHMGRFSADYRRQFGVLPSEDRPA